MKRYVLVCCLSFVGLTCKKASDADAVSEKNSADYVQEIEDWRSKREAKLRDPMGWLTLAGLHWLEQGEHSLGTGPDVDVRLPDEGGAKKMGSLVVGDGGAVTLKALPKANLLVEDKPVAQMTLRNDEEGEPTVVWAGPIHFFIIKRADKVAVRVKNKNSKALRDFSGMDYFPIEPAFRFEGRFEKHPQPKSIKFATSANVVTEEVSSGLVRFAYKGQQHSLDAIEAGDKLFLIFRDLSSGKETYGAGRFLYADPPGADQRVVVDFNKAHNPPCVFTPYATCPYPPKQNHLKIAVRAGEKSYRHH